MEIRVLRYFLAVAREENITRAAEYLNITQPTLSRQLALLEEETGTQLFQRGSRRITLTEEGILLKRRAEEIVSLADRTLEELNADNKTISGTVSIGTGGLAANTMILRAAEQMRKEYPDVRFSIFTGTADLVRERIDYGLADFGILLEPVSVEKYNFIRLPQKERWVALLRKDHPLAGNKIIHAADLKKETLVLPERSSVRAEVMNWFMHDEPETAYTSNLSSTAAEIVMASGAAALIIDGSLSYFDNTRLVKIPLDPPLESGTVLAYKKGIPFTPAAEEFYKKIQCLKGI